MCEFQRLALSRLAPGVTESTLAATDRHLRDVRGLFCNMSERTATGAVESGEDVGTCAAGFHRIQKESNIFISQGRAILVFDAKITDNQLEIMSDS